MTARPPTPSSTSPRGGGDRRRRVPDRRHRQQRGAQGVGGGVITRVAGTGTAGNSGDDGPATDAQLNGPFGVAVTADGGFLIADTGNNEVRKVSAAG